MVLMRSVLVLLGVLVLELSVAHAAPRDSKELEKILNKVDDLYRGESSTGKMTMTVVTRHWKRTLQMEFHSKGKDRFLMKILSPKKERGTTTLRVKKDMWNYLPKVKRIIKVPVSMMGGSWMGSHFTNDDLVKQSRMANDFNSRISFDGVRDGRGRIEITSVAKEDAVVVWGKMVIEVDQKTYFPLQIRYFDEDLVLARTMTFGEPVQFSGRTIPASMKLTSEDKPNEFTEVRYDSLDFVTAVPDALFSRRNLER